MSGESKEYLERELLRKQIEREEKTIAIINDIPYLALSFLRSYASPPTAPVPRLAIRRVRAGPFKEAEAKLAEEEKKIEDEIMESLKEDIHETAEDLLTSVVRKNISMFDGGTKKKIQEEIKKGKKPKLKRKKGCLYLSIGDGVTSEIEEFYLSV